MFKKLLFILVLSISVISTAQIVNIPDANFKACLVANTDINTNNDSEIQVSEALNYSGDIICGGLNISSVVGIEAFTNATGASFNNNEIAAIDISQNTAFTFISVSNNNLTNFDVTSNSNLISINCGQNQLSSLDVSNNPLLFNLRIRINNIAAIDVSNLPALGRFDAAGCNISSIDFTNNPLLEEVNLSANDITTLNLSQNNNLEIARLEQLPTLASVLFANGVPLEQLYLSESNLPNFNFNQLTTLEVLFLIDMPGIEILDLSNLSQIGTLGIFDMPDLTALNITNPNYANGFVVLTDNFMLNCVEVATNIDLNNLPADWDITPVPSITYDCGLPAPIVNISDANFKTCLLANGAVNTNGDSEIQISEAAAFTGELFCENMGITSASGLEFFISISGVSMGGNVMTTFNNLPSGSNVTSLDVNDNMLSDLNLINGEGLTLLNASNNNLSQINLTGAENLEQVFVGGNQLTNPDFSAVNATTIIVNNNPITQLDLFSQTNLENLFAEEIDLLTLDVSNNAQLAGLYAQNASLTNVDLSNNPLLFILRLQNNDLTTLDVSNNPMLGQLLVNDNNLTSLNIANGNNAILGQMDATTNASLNCIQIDASIDPNNPPAGWSKDTTAVYNEDCTLSVNDFATRDIAIFPNPTTGIVNISATVNIQEIKISNLQGQVILTQTQPQIDLSTFSSGIYFITLKDAAGSTYLKKIIKE